jgi:hypothetical protein
MISRNHLGYIAPQQHSLGQACGNGAHVKSFSAHASRSPRNRASLLSPVRGGSLAQIRPIVGQASRLRPVRGCPPRCASRSLCGFRSAASTGSGRGVTLWHLLAPHGTTRPNQGFRIVPQHQLVMRFPEQPPKLGVARSNRARVTITSTEQPQRWPKPCAFE